MTTAAERVPPWLRSPKLLVPIAVVAMFGLLFAFASVVQDIVHQGEMGNGVPVGAVTSPGVDRP